MGSRFHNKFHRQNHHTNATPGNPDSASDPIASHSHPFQGDFVVNGQISAKSLSVGILSATELHAVSAFIHYQDLIVSELSGFVVNGTSASLSIPASIVAGDNNVTLNGVGLSANRWASFDGDLQTKRNLVVSGNATHDGYIYITNNGGLILDYPTNNNYAYSANNRIYWFAGGAVVGYFDSGAFRLFNDRSLLYGGDTARYWTIYNSTTKQYELWTADGDTAGTDTLLMSVSDGTTNTKYNGTITINASSILTNTIPLDIQAVNGANSGDWLMRAGDATDANRFGVDGDGNARVDGGVYFGNTDGSASQLFTNRLKLGGAPARIVNSWSPGYALDIAANNGPVNIGYSSADAYTSTVVNIHTPLSALSNIIAEGVISADGGNSDQWNTAYSTVSAGSWLTVDGIDVTYTPTNYTATSANVSGHFDGIDIAIGAINADITVIAGASANWDSAYTTSQANLADITVIATTSANWDSAYTTSQANLADITVIAGASANWDSAYGTVSGGTYGAADGVDISYTPTNYTATNANISGNFDGIDTTLGTKANIKRPNVILLAGTTVYNVALNQSSTTFVVSGVDVGNVQFNLPIPSVADLGTYYSFVKFASGTWITVSAHDAKIDDSDINGTIYSGSSAAALSAGQQKFASIEVELVLPTQWHVRNGRKIWTTTEFV